jgi:hypothetical protein
LYKNDPSGTDETTSPQDAASAPRAAAGDAEYATPDEALNLRDDARARKDRARTEEYSAANPVLHSLGEGLEVSRPLIPTAEAPEVLPQRPE